MPHCPPFWSHLHRSEGQAYMVMRLSSMLLNDMLKCWLLNDIGESSAPPGTEDLVCVVPSKNYLHELAFEAFPRCTARHVDGRTSRFNADSVCQSDVLDILSRGQIAGTGKHEAYFVEPRDGYFSVLKRYHRRPKQWMGDSFSTVKVHKNKTRSWK